MKKFFLVCVLSYVFFCGGAESVELQKIRSVELKNGMQIHVIPDNRLPVAMHMLVYKVGGMDDPPGLSGIAHYFEHLMFSGTKRFPKFPETINGIGGELNAGTTTSYTAFYELINKRHLPLIMEMEADRMRNLQLTKEVMERERKVVREERKMRVESTVKGLLIEELYNVFYRNGYGMPVIGWDHEITNYNRRSADSFYHKYYNPNSAVLLVIGDVNFRDVVRLANKYYGKIKNLHEPPRAAFATKIDPEHRNDIIVKTEHPSVTEPVAVMLYQAPSIGTNSDKKIRASVLIASDIVAGDGFGVLYHELVNKRAIATRVAGAYNDRERSQGIVAVEIAPRNGVTPGDVNAVAKEIIAGLVAGGVTEELLNDAKYRSMANFTYGLDDIEGRAWFYASTLAAGSDLILPEYMLETIKSVTVEDVNEALKSVFSGATVEAHLMHRDDRGDVLAVEPAVDEGEKEGEEQHEE